MHRSRRSGRAVSPRVVLVRVADVTCHPRLDRVIRSSVLGDCDERIFQSAVYLRIWPTWTEQVVGSHVVLR